MIGSTHDPRNVEVADRLLLRAWIGATVGCLSSRIRRPHRVKIAMNSSCEGPTPSLSVERWSVSDSAIAPRLLCSTVEPPANPTAKPGHSDAAARREPPGNESEPQAQRFCHCASQELPIVAMRNWALVRGGIGETRP